MLADFQNSLAVVFSMKFETKLSKTHPRPVHRRAWMLGVRWKPGINE